MSRFNRKIDNVQNGIVHELRSSGYKVFITSRLGNGFCDIVVNDGFINWLVELKNTKKDKLTEKELRFEENFYTIVASSTEEIIKEIEQNKIELYKNLKEYFNA